MATKTDSRDADEVKRHLTLSLERLRLETIDLYQLHGVSSDEDYAKVVAPGGPLDAVRGAQAAGHVKHIGLTSHSMEIALKAVRSGHFETIMFPFNFVANEAATELIPMALERNVGFIAMKPLAGGALDDANLAFKYLRQYPQILPIPGIERAAEIAEIVALMEAPADLTVSERAQMQRLQTDLGNRFCRRCGYCQPCPEGVSVQSLMILDSIIKRMAPDHVFAQFAQLVDEAGSCTECGECEDSCPYNLPIREMIKERMALFRQEMALAGVL